MIGGNIIWMVPEYSGWLNDCMIACIHAVMRSCLPIICFNFLDWAHFLIIKNQIALS